MDDHILALFSEGELASAMEANIVHPQNHRFHAVSTDSRNIENGDLFVALSGERFDAHDFVADVIKKGAAGAVVSRVLDTPAQFTLFVVDDVLKAFGRLAKAMLQKRRALGGFTTYAITGSNGKTTSKEMLAALLAVKGHKVLKTQGNHNNFVGLPITVMALESTHDVAVLEMGTNAHGEIAYLSQIGCPDKAMITCVGSAHLEGFGSIEGVAKAKGEMIHAPGLKKIILPTETHRFYDSGIPQNLDVTWVGEGESIYVKNIDSSIEGVDFDLVDGKDKYRVHLPILGSHNAENFARAYAMVRDEHFTEHELNQAAADIHLPSGRLERWIGKDGVSFLHDAYNANPSSMAQALKLIQSISEKERRCLILGMMGELGTDTEKLHQELGKQAAETGAKKILCVGDLAPFIAQGAIDNHFHAEDIRAVKKDELDEGLQWLNPSLTKDTICLIKGSRSVRLERVLDFFEAHREE